jgi:hypothetical protein
MSEANPSAVSRAARSAIISFEPPLRDLETLNSPRSSFSLQCRCWWTELPSHVAVAVRRLVGRQPREMCLPVPLHLRFVPHEAERR